MLNMAHIGRYSTLFRPRRPSPGLVKSCTASTGNLLRRQLSSYLVTHLHASRGGVFRNFATRATRTFAKREPFNGLKRQGQLIVLRRFSQNTGSRADEGNKSTIIYIAAAGVFMLGMSYAGVPLYRMFCQATGAGGQATDAKGHNTAQIASMKPIKERVIKVKFNADLAASMRWNFRPQQTEVVVVPGETALAFYTAKNPTDKPIIGISTYNVVPFEAGQYFNKIQCFCFEEQRLNPHETVDMPVFFYIDPAYAEDPFLQSTNVITLSYTFFEAKEGLTIPLPGYLQNPS